MRDASTSAQPRNASDSFDLEDLRELLDKATSNKEESDWVQQHTESIDIIREQAQVKAGLRRSCVNMIRLQQRSVIPRGFVSVREYDDSVNYAARQKTELAEATFGLLCGMRPYRHFFQLFLSYMQPLTARVCPIFRRTYFRLRPS